MSSATLPFPYITFFGKDTPPCRIELANTTFSIGRGPDNNLQIKDLLISRNHAEIIRVGEGRYLFRDKESKSGSFINGVRVLEQYLKDGDEIILGDVQVARIAFTHIVRHTGQHRAVQYRDSVTDAPTSPVKPVLPWEVSGTTIITDQQTRFLNTDLMLQPQYVTARTLQRLTSLYEITHKLLPAHDTTELVSIWLDAIFKALPVEHGAILLYDKSSGHLEVAINRDRGNTGALTTFSNTIVEQTFRENVAILTSDATSDERFSSKESIIIQNIRSVLSAPISSKQRVWGVCYLYSRTQTALFDSEDLEFLMATAREAGLVIENLNLIEELRATQEQLIKSERLAAIGKLASSISHELKNRLALLSGAELLEMKYEDDPEVKEFTAMVREGQQRALALVDEIRGFARNRPTDFAISKRPLVPVVQKVVSLMKLDPVVMRRRLVFEFSESPEVLVNEEKIEQVLLNLIRNAADATTESAGEIHVEVESEHNFALVRIEDNGAGIPDEIIERIWEPFFTTKGDEGTGLGLEICRRIVEAHHGSIFCTSAVGRGTCFTIQLPLA